MRFRTTAAVAAALAWTIAVAPTASAAVTVTERVASFEVDLALRGEATCDNASTTVDITGDMTGGDVDVLLLFSNNARGTRTDSTTSTAAITLTPETLPLEIPKQPPLGGAGGNPSIWIDLDGDDAGPILLGRCVQGLSFDLRSPVHVPASLAFVFEALECSNRGSTVTVGAEAGTDPITGELILTNNRNARHAAEGGDASVAVTLDPAAEIRKGGGHAEGAGGNPWISVRYRQGGGDWSAAEAIGRCQDLR
ncbi:MAG: hypothetical protein ACKO8G_08325 [Actinomycetota bacterium]